MDNVSKAITFSFAIFITLAIISITISVFGMLKEANSKVNDTNELLQISEFNKFFLESSYDINSNVPDVQINGWDVYNIIRKIEDINSDIFNEREIKISGVVTSSGAFLVEDSYTINTPTGSTTTYYFMKPTNYMTREYTYYFSIGPHGYIDSVTFN